MARIRTIKPEFFTSLTVADLTPEQRLTFIGLWTHADDEGRCVDDPRLIKAAIWPLDDRTAADIETDLQALSESSLITRYILNRKRYLAVTNWREHQKINRPTPSKLPSPEQGENPTPEPPTSGNSDSSTSHGELTEPSPPERKGTGNREQGKETDTSAVANRDQPPPDAHHPADADKPRGAEAELIRHDIERICRALADAVEANGSKRPEITKRWRTAARLLIDKDGRTVDQILTAIAWCQDDEFWRGNVLSMPTLRKQYDRLRLAAQRERRQQHGTALAPTGTTGHPLPGTDSRVAGWLALPTGESS